MFPSPHLGQADPILEGYRDDDYPHQLPPHIPSVALTIEDSDSYGLANFDAYADWRTTDLFSHGNGFVKLGPEGGFRSILLRLTRKAYTLGVSGRIFGTSRALVILPGSDEVQSRYCNVPPDALSAED
jgi:hypothetical protein